MSRGSRARGADRWRCTLQPPFGDLHSASAPLTSPMLTATHPTQTHVRPHIHTLLLRTHNTAARPCTRSLFHRHPHTDTRTQPTLNQNALKQPYTPHTIHTHGCIQCAHARLSVSTPWLAHSSHPSYLYPSRHLHGHTDTHYSRLSTHTLTHGNALPYTPQLSPYTLVPAPSPSRGRTHIKTSTSPCIAIDAYSWPF
jgi:hypothetical protein